MNPNYIYTVTLYNCLKPADSPDRKERWYRCVLPGCYYKAQIHTVQNGIQAGQSNTYIVRIPEDERYLSYKEWVELTEQERTKHFTAAAGDIIVLGECREEITGEPGCAAARVLNRHKPDAFKVTALSDNTKTRTARHYRLGG